MGKWRTFVVFCSNTRNDDFVPVYWTCETVRSGVLEEPLGILQDNECGIQFKCDNNTPLRIGKKQPLSSYLQEAMPSRLQ